MKKVHTEEQIVGILRGHEASGLSVKEFCRSKGIHETTFYNWKKRYGTMDVEEVRHCHRTISLGERNRRTSPGHHALSHKATPPNTKPPPKDGVRAGRPAARLFTTNWRMPSRGRKSWRPARQNCRTGDGHGLTSVRRSRPDLRASSSALRPRPSRCLP